MFPFLLISMPMHATIYYKWKTNAWTVSKTTWLLLEAEEYTSNWIAAMSFMISNVPTEITDGIAEAST